MIEIKHDQVIIFNERASVPVLYYKVNNTWFQTTLKDSESKIKVVTEEQVQQKLKTCVIAYEFIPTEEIDENVDHILCINGRDINVYAVVTHKTTRYWLAYTFGKAEWLVSDLISYDDGLELITSADICCVYLKTNSNPTDYIIHDTT